jgi:hypothetical protein
MRAVLRLAAHEFHTRWKGWAVLMLLAGLAGGAVLTAAAGARRTDTAYPRFLEAYKASDVLVSAAGSGVGGYDDALAGLSEVGWALEQPADSDAESTSHAEAPDTRLARMEAALTIAQEAIASLVRRVGELESSTR